MKYDRIQEMLRYITPGLYLFALLLVINFDLISDNPKVRDTIVAFSAIIIVLIPFVGFVVGYFIECLMTMMERFVYWIHIPRPSKVVLNGSRKSYIIENDLRMKILNGVACVDNDTANRCRQIAKQVVGVNDIVDRYYYQSIMARHILGAQIMGSVYYLVFAGGWSWCHLIWSIVIIAILTYFWYHQNCVYMKYLFFEYGKKLSESERCNT